MACWTTNSLADVYTVKSDNDGRILIGGDLAGGEAFLIRRLAEGGIDRAFQQSWLGSGFDDAVRTLALQADDKILVGGDFATFNGTNQAHLLRLNSDGSLDQEFAKQMQDKLNGNVTSILLLSDGSIFVAGSFTRFGEQEVPYYVKLTPEGELDTTFNFQNRHDAPVTTAHYDSTNQIILLGGGFRDDNGLRRPLIQMTESGEPVVRLELKLK